MENVLTHKVRKRKSTRNAMRILGMLFAAGGGFLMYYGIMISKRLMFLKAGIGLLLALYGFMLLKSSFKKSAYDATYIFGDKHILIQQKRWNTIVKYSSITDVLMITPDNEQAYYILKIARGKYNYILPFPFNKKKCERIYEYVRERAGINEGQDSEDTTK